MTAMALIERLEPKAQAALSLPQAEREEYIRKDNWVPYSKAAKVLGTLEDLMIYPKVTRPHCFLLVGDADNGKTTLFERFAYVVHPQTTLPTHDPTMPVVYVSLPAKPVESRFWSAVLHALPVTYQDSDSAHLKECQAKEVFVFLKTRLILFDQVNHLASLAPREQRVTLSTMRELSTSLRIPVAAAGTSMAINAIRTDPQLYSRFTMVETLPRWEARNEDYWRVLASLERMLPLAEPSNLGSTIPLGLKIFSLSGSTIGGIVRVVKNAAIAAIRARMESINLEVLKKVEYVGAKGNDSPLVM